MSLPSNTRKLRIYLDASALFAAVFSDSGGARALLRLGGAGAVELVVSSQTLAEAESALRRKAPQVLGHVALLLDRSRCRVIANPAWEQVLVWREVIPYEPDAAILAAAVAAEADYLVTLDRQHFLDLPALAEAASLPIGTPGDCLAWLRARLLRR